MPLVIINNRSSERYVPDLISAFHYYTPHSDLPGSDQRVTVAIGYYNGTVQIFKVNIHNPDRFPPILKMSGTFKKQSIKKIRVNKTIVIIQYLDDSVSVYEISSGTLIRDFIIPNGGEFYLTDNYYFIHIRTPVRGTLQLFNNMHKNTSPISDAPILEYSPLLLLRLTDVASIESFEFQGDGPHTRDALPIIVATCLPSGGECILHYVRPGANFRLHRHRIVSIPFTGYMVNMFMAFKNSVFIVVHSRGGGRRGTDLVKASLSEIPNISLPDYLQDKMVTISTHPVNVEPFKGNAVAVYDPTEATIRIDETMTRAIDRKRRDYEGNLPTAWRTDNSLYLRGSKITQPYHFFQGAIVIADQGQLKIYYDNTAFMYSLGVAGAPGVPPPGGGAGGPGGAVAGRYNGLPAAAAAARANNNRIIAANINRPNAANPNRVNALAPLPGPAPRGGRRKLRSRKHKKTHRRRVTRNRKHRSRK